jgi:hypothetical protein
MSKEDEPAAIALAFAAEPASTAMFSGEHGAGSSQS